MLKKYDEEIEGKEDGGFRLGGPAPVRKAGAAGKGKAKDDEPERERVKLSMEYTSSYESRILAFFVLLTCLPDTTETFTTDYLQEDEVGFKKPKVSHPAAFPDVTRSDTRSTYRRRRSAQPAPRSVAATTRTAMQRWVTRARQSPRSRA